MPDVTLHELTVEQTLRWRALELSVVTCRDTIRFGADGQTFDKATAEMVKRADAFHAYVEDGTSPFVEDEDEE